ncbi:MAG: ADP-ribosylglycohydrolase family protein [Proteobacteria bacterium]|nr:ADP-ribosylglycohydrolase family protein [Pseudomonadota bacterium]
MTPKTPEASASPDWTRPRPIDTTYWVVPGRFLVGEHPGSRSRARSMDRLRRFLEAGITCFIDLTEPDESSAYDRHLPFETSSGRRIDYRRQPIPDHGVPADRATMDRILAMLDDALSTGHGVYLHCRAGIGRSATVAGCWLAERNPGGGEAALTELGDYWRQCRQSRSWPQVPETSEQEEFVRNWQPLRPGVKGVAKSSGPARGLALEQRVRGGWFGLALGDALGATSAAAATRNLPLAWTQHTSLALCLAESLNALGRSDARDQIERYWRWFKDGHLTATGQPGETGASPDVAKALATFRWRGLPVAGSHDPKDAAATSLPRVLAAALFAGNNPAGAIALAAECSRTTHQSPLVLDTCRAYSAMLLCALRGQPAHDWLRAVPEPLPGCWTAKPLRKDVQAAVATAPPAEGATATGGTIDVVQALALARRIAGDAKDFDAAIVATRRNAGDEAALVAGLVGTMFGLQHGMDVLPPDASSAGSRAARTSKLRSIIALRA